MLKLINGKIVLSNKTLVGYDLYIDNGKIIDICKHLSMSKSICDIIDCKDAYIMPGLIDLHCDTLESIIVPRKGIQFNIAYSLLQSDRQYISQGITTMYHSISVANSTIVNRKRTLTVSNQLEIGKTIKQTKDLLINHKYHARFELNTIEAYNPILNMLYNKEIDELSFMDHTPGQGQYRDLEMFKKEIDKQYGYLSETKKSKVIADCISKPKLSTKQIDCLIATCHNQNVPLTYHDVDKKAIVDWMKANHFSICEFPLELSVAEDIKKAKIHTLVGAPNIIIGRSHNNNLSALELLKTGLAHIICSDYYSPAMLQSIFILQKYGFTLEESVRFGTYNPAIAMGIKNKGIISVGNVADIIVVNVTDFTPYVTAALVNGELKYMIKI